MLYRFKPKLISSLATLVLFPVLLSLGFWQLGRMEEKEQLLNLQAQGENTAPLAFQDLGTQPLRYTHVKVSGKFLPRFSIFLEHQLFEGQVGYQVLTPLEIAPDLPLLWVNRGWVAQDNALDALSAPDTSLNLLGLINYPAAYRFILGDNLSIDNLGQIKIQHIDIPLLSQHFQQPFYPYILLLDPKSPAGYVRDWQIKTLPPSKHLGYAVQWFALALTLLILYLVVNLQPRKKP